MLGEFGHGHERLRSWFDGADEFLEFCANNYSPVSIMENIAFDQKKEMRFWQKRVGKTAKKYDTLVKLCDSIFSSISVPKHIIIYGAGHIGRNFYKKVKGNCEVVCFVDKKEKGKEIDGIPVVGMEEIRNHGDLTFVVTATQNYEKIKTEIEQYCNAAFVISLDELYCPDVPTNNMEE